MKRYVRNHRHSKDFLRISLGADHVERDRFNIVVRKIGADLTACVQSLHSLPDILASAVYFSLALNRQFIPRSGKYVNHAFVLECTAKVGSLHSLNAQLRLATQSANFRHVAALANQSKHYSIVFPALSTDLTGSREQQYMLAFPEFKTGSKVFPQVYVTDLLPAVHDQLSRAVVETGHALSAALRSAA